MSRYIVFEGAPHYHVLEDEDETACGVMVAAVSTLAGQSPKVTVEPPHGVIPCKRCDTALDKPTLEGPPRRAGRIEVEDWVHVVAGPQAGKAGRVVTVIRGKGESDSSAVFKVKFSDGGEAGHVGANLKKINS